MVVNLYLSLDAVEEWATSQEGKRVESEGPGSVPGVRIKLRGTYAEDLA